MNLKLAALPCCLLLSGAALAQATPAPDYTLSFNVGAGSD